MKTKTQQIDLEPVKILLNKHKMHKSKYMVTINTLRLIVLPEVFCPAYTNTSVFLADTVKVSPNDTVLDMFSGSGYQAINVAKKVKEVVAVDHSPIAVRCITQNIALHKLSSKIHVYQSDLFTSVPKRRFDIIIANPPLLPGIPKSILETAVLDNGLLTTKRFLETAGLYLKSSGKIYLLFSDVCKKVGLGGIDFVKNIANKHNFSMTILAEKPVGYETYSVLLLTRRRKT